MRYALILSLAVFLVGCFEEPTLTWTTDVELRQSIENVRESLPDSQQAIFMDAIHLYQTANDPAPKPSFDHIEDVVERIEAERDAYDFVADCTRHYLLARI
jgi:PBP1b-binding outer membrane lipoprotein LpoB